MEASTEWKMGGTHSIPTALGLGISALPQHTPNFRFFFVLDWEGAQKVFYPPRPDYRRFKIPSFTSPGHTHSLVCAPTTTFSFCRPVMSYKLSFPMMHYRIYSQYHIYNALKKLAFFRALTASSGGGGGGGGARAPRPPPPP